MGRAVAGGDGDGDGEQEGQGIFYIAGGRQASPADYALWPVLHDIVRVCGEEVLTEYPYLTRYYQAFRERSAVAKVLGMAGGVVSVVVK
jgi:glutathione S-transferase